MSNPSTNIPALFYDIISRIIPGVVITIGILVLLLLAGIIVLDTTLIDFVTSINFLFLLLSVGYLSGFLLGTLSQVLDFVFRYGYNPAIDYLRIGDTKQRGKRFVSYLEFVMGLPFSLFLLNEYIPKGVDNYIVELKDLIKKRLGKGALESHMNLILCRDYVRARDKELGNNAMKMSAESAMCRNLVVVFFILTLVSVYYSLTSAIVVNALLCTLSMTNFSSRRRTYIAQIYSYYFALEKSNAK